MPEQDKIEDLVDKELLRKVEERKQEAIDMQIRALNYFLLLSYLREK